LLVILFNVELSETRLRKETIPIMTSTNPVHRIYNLLDEANTKRPNLSISGVWSEVFELEPKNKVLLSRLASDLHKLFLIAIEQVERLLTKDEYDIYIVAFNAIKPLFEPFSWDREWGNRNLGQFLKDLKLCAITLSRMEEANEKLVDLEKLKSLREMAVELQEEVFSADLPNDFKTILLDNLSNIIYAVAVAADLRQSALDPGAGPDPRHFQQHSRKRAAGDSGRAARRLIRGGGSAWPTSRLALLFVGGKKRHACSASLSDAGHRRARWRSKDYGYQEGRDRGQSSG
jgi:hypothetical protein